VKVLKPRNLAMWWRINSATYGAILKKMIQELFAGASMKELATLEAMKWRNLGY
jgi:hypothetical protein